MTSGYLKMLLLKSRLVEEKLLVFRKLDVKLERKPCVKRQHQHQTLQTDNK